MKTRLLFASFAFFVCTQIFAQENAAEKFVKALSERKNGWLVKPNLDSLQGLIDSRCLYIHSNGWVQSAKDVVDDLKSKKIVYKKISGSESTARQFEKMVIVTGKAKFEGTMKGNDFSFDLAFTEVYVNRASGWKLVSRHASRIVP